MLWAQMVISMVVDSGGNNNNQNNNDNTKRFNNNRGPGMGPQTGNRRNDLGMYNSVVLENNH